MVKKIDEVDEDLRQRTVEAYEYDDVPQCRQPIQELELDDVPIVADDEYDEEYYPR